MNIFCEKLPETGRRGFAMAYVMAIGVILLILGGVLFQMVGRHHEELMHFSESQGAVYLAEAGVGFTIQEVRKALEEGNSGGVPSELTKLLTQTAPVPSTSIITLFDDSWSYNLGVFAGEVDIGASIKVEAWFEKFQPTETKSESWNDPVAKQGFLTVRSTGKYHEVTRTVTAKRPIWAGNVLPPVVTKFSLRMTDGFRGKADRFNTLVNDKEGRFVEGDRPLVVYNHSLPDDPFSPQPPLESEPANVFENRGWIWIGGSSINLHLTAGSSENGEIFHLYQVANPGSFKAGKFLTSLSLLPPPFSSVHSLSWDNPPGYGPRTTDYRFGHAMVLEGFYDKSPTSEHQAMYEGNLLSAADATEYGAKSSSLHLFGDVRKGYQSRTKVLGYVNSDLVKLAQLDVQPQEPDVAAIFSSAAPPALYYLAGLSAGAFNPEGLIREFLNRAVGGPILKAGILFPQYDQYAQHMCKIAEISFAEIYNLMGEATLSQDKRTFPVAQKTLSLDEGQNLELRRKGELLYKGSVRAAGNIDVIRNRVQVEFLTVDSFWTRYYQKNDRVLRLNTIVKIQNPAKDPLVFPPPGFPAPLEIEGAGLILLEQGSIVSHGVRLRDGRSALSIVAPNADTVTLEQVDQHHLNIVAPKARLVIQDPGTIYGSVEIGDALQSSAGKGGNVRFREIQDPTREDPSGNDYRQFYRACVGEMDKVWHD